MLNYHSSAKTADQLRHELIRLLENERMTTKSMAFLDKTIRAKEYRRGMLDKIDYWAEMLDTLKLDLREDLPAQEHS